MIRRILYLLGISVAWATHWMGMDVYYQCIGQDTYRIWITWYKDCSGSSFCLPDDPPNCGSCNCMDLNFKLFPSGCAAPVPLGPWVAVATEEEITPVCPTVQTTCTNPNAPIKGVQRGVYFRDYYFGNSPRCDSVIIELYGFTRNDSIINIQNSSSVNLYSGVTKIDLTAGCNSSPVFSELPVPYVCLNQPFVFNQGATDIDGDSLSYSLGPCWDYLDVPGQFPNGTPVIVPYQPPYSATNPMASNPPLSVDPITGDISMFPTQRQKATLCIYVTEWRNGVPIGQVMRDIQITVLNCGNQVQPQIAGIDSTWVFVDTICAYQPVSFEIPIYDPNLGDNITIGWNNGIPSATFTVIGPRKALFQWNNPIPRAAPYLFTVYAKDDACPIEGRTQRTFVLYVRGGDITVMDTALVNCNVGYFSAPVLGGTPPFTVQWYGDGGLNVTGSTASYAYPDSGTYQYYVEVTDGAGCTVKDSGTVRINVVPPSLETLWSDTSVCVDDTASVLYIGTAPDTAQFQWDFGAGAQPSTASGKGPHNVSWDSPGPKPVLLTIYMEGCAFSNADSMDTVMVYPRPIADAGEDTLVCGNSLLIQLQGTSNVPGSSFQWWPATGLSNPNVPNPWASVDTTTVYYLVASYGSCSGPVDSIKIIINPKPVITLDTGIVVYCIGGDPVELPANVSEGTPPYFIQWTPANYLSNPYVLRPLASPPSNQLYWLHITDALGCEADSVPVYVQAVERPIAYAGEDTFICEGGPGVFLQGSVLNPGFGSYDYQWSPANSLNNPNIANPYATPDTTTIYTLVVTSTYTGCSSDPLDSNATVVVYVIPKPIANAGPDVEVCYKDSVQLGDLPQGTDSNFTYLWTPSLGLSDSTAPRPWASPPHTVTYFLVVNNNGCLSDADSVTVTVKPYPQVQLKQPYYEMCAGDSIQLQTTTAIVGSYTGNILYQWSPSAYIVDSTAENPIVFPPDTMTFYVWASIQGCPLFLQDSAVVIVRHPPLIDADTTGIGWHKICMGDSIVLPAKVLWAVDPYYVYWTPATGLSDSTAVNPKAAPTEGTTYYFHGVYAGCESIDSVKIFVEGGYSVRLQSDTNQYCSSDTIVLTAVGGYGSATFLWNPQPLQTQQINDTTQIAQIQLDTSQYVYVYVYEGDSTCIVADSLFLQVYPDAIADFTYSIEEGCNQLKVSFLNQSQGAHSYFWDFGDGTISNEVHPVHVYAQGGTYVVTLSVNSNGLCLSQATKQAVITLRPGLQPQIIADPEAPIKIPLGTTIYFRYKGDTTNNGARFIVWDFGDGHHATTRETKHTYEKPGYYQVTLYVTDSMGCTYEVQTPTYVVLAPQLDVPNVFTPNGDGYNDRIVFRYDGTQPFEVQVVDRWGRVVFSASQPNVAWDGTFQGKPLPEGQYFYVIRIGETIYRGSITLVR